MSQHHAVLALLLQIEGEMRRIELWSDSLPEPEALLSQEPFCVDTLGFEEWVQWLLLPRLELMAQQRLPLPGNSLIAPMAEEAFKHLPADTDQLLQLIDQLDRTLNGTA